MLTVAVAEWILTGQDLTDLFQDYYRNYPGRGYGGRFHEWASRRQRNPYNSFGNGSAMRVSPVGFAFETLEEVVAWAGKSAAEAFYGGIPRELVARAMGLLDARLAAVVDRFRSRFGLTAGDA